MTALVKTGKCPKCGGEVEFEPSQWLPKIVPLCDGCELKQTENWASDQRREIWRRLYVARLPDGYVKSNRYKVERFYQPALAWTPVANHGGLGLIGDAGSGKSSAMACLLWTLETPFLWWSGTEARDAAIEAATADKDREGANRRWEHAMRIPLLVIDDISQGRLTEAWSSKLFDLLETRLGGALPTLWTSQISIAELKAKIIRQNGQDSAQAEAITRRLAQHSLVLKS